ncbi:hypothetical protein RN001_015969 [Aquatica leii]|uniref:Coilin n=1 Tax=Aquatica leii TaxID=1421715 RepID=A0AAN7SMX6_9COLE|nr:hypothetical protein RN001_015969 [Aquatica leii]
MSSENIQKASNINSNQSANVKEIDHSNENLAGPSGLQKIREQETTPPGFKTALSPEMIRPLPKASNRTNRTQRKKRKSAILTDTPIKDEIEQEKMSRQNKKQAKSIKKNLSSTQKKTKDEFKQTKKRNYEWEGNTEDKSLYNVWHQIASDVKGLPKLVSEDPALKNDLQTHPVSLLDASILIDMLPVDKPKEVPGTSNDSNTTLATTSRPDRVEQVTRNICFAQKTICSKVFYNVLPYPKKNNTDSKKKKRKKEYTPSVITSDKWVEYHEECERLKIEKEREKQERKQARESKKQMMAKKCEKLKQKPTKHQKQDIDSGSSSQDLEDWVESGSSGDDIDFTVFEQEDIEIFELKDLNLGDFVLVRFKLTGKRSTTTYRYVAKILEILSSEEYEIQCNKTANDQMTVFYPIEKDISTINQCDILGKLPEPTVEDKGRKCKTIFPGQVDISEQI